METMVVNDGAFGHETLHAELAIESVTTPRSSCLGTISQPELTIQTTDADHNILRSKSSCDDDEEPPQSVIHAPPGFNEFKTSALQHDNKSTSNTATTLSIDSDVVLNLPFSNKSGILGKKISNSPISPPPLTTAIEPTRDWSERATPRAQTMQDFEDLDRISHSSNLEDIPEGFDAERVGQEQDRMSGHSLAMVNVSDGEVEVKALRVALTECWSLCNTLASLSYIHRERLQCNGTDMQEESWKSCWRLCQELYDGQDDETTSQVNSTLDLCRKFCQTLFDARMRDNELADSVLRVSFELNNHLYNTHDRFLPDAFRERTLDFYITLCHRLMKQRTREFDIDSLLSACWSLAEMLFSIRQSKRDGERLDEELLGSAVQACWELCDIFREGWTQRSLRNSDRGTPRPSQATFTQTAQQVKQPELDLSGKLPEQQHQHQHQHQQQQQQRNPETPTTIFEDTALVSPDEAPIQNIFVLGQGSNEVSKTKWPSNSSSVSGRTQSSEQTSSTNTITTLTNNPTLTSLKILMTKAAINSGFQRGGQQSLSSFVKSLSSDAFGSMPWQISLLKNYKGLVATDHVFRSIGPQARGSAIEIARAVRAMIQNGQCPWMVDLYRLVFGFHLEEGRQGIFLQV